MRLNLRKVLSFFAQLERKLNYITLSLIGIKLGIQINRKDLHIVRSVRFKLGYHPEKKVRGVIKLGESVELNDNVEINCFGGLIDIGSNTYIGPNTILYGHGDIQIGCKCLIAMNVVILSSTHTIPGLGFYIRDVADKRKKTVIGDGVWIAAGAIILGGVTIGSGAVVGAGAVVAVDIPPNTIVTGNRELNMKSRL